MLLRKSRFERIPYSIPNATIRLVANRIRHTGNQSRRSFAFGGMELAITLSPENTTTPQMNFPEASENPGKNTFAAEKTTATIRTSKMAWAMAAILIPGGKRPGNFPAIAYEPQGAPNARPN